MSLRADQAGTANAGTPGMSPAEELLAEAVARVGGVGGSLYSTSASGDVEQLAAMGRGAAVSGAGTRQAAQQALQERRPRLERMVAGAADGHGAASLLVLPCGLAGEPSAVLVVGLDGAQVDLEPLVDRAGSLLALALAADHERVLRTLEAHRELAAAVQRQLEAYAVDLRSTYSAERQKAAELTRALDELAETYRATVRGLAIAVEAKDEYTGGHLQRVTRYGLAVTAVVAPDHLHDPQFEYGFLLHDVGKLTVPDAILTKPGKLTDEEWIEIRAHPEAGRMILEDIPFLAGAREIVHAHHERWDGKGYPRGLAGEDIPLGARIFPLADAFDAMTSDRPYRAAMSIGDATDELRRGAGTQFWTDAVDAFVHLDEEELRALRLDVP